MPIMKRCITGDQEVIWILGISNLEDDAIRNAFQIQFSHPRGMWRGALIPQSSVHKRLCKAEPLNVTAALQRRSY